jgi:predicted Holliday junction resolvase-like endonuclease
MELLLVVAIVIIIVAFVSVPLRSRGAGEAGDEDESELAELEARKQAKYREIRDAEADRASDKLSEEDHRRLDRELRREAVDILKRIDRLRGPQEPEERGG